MSKECIKSNKSIYFKEEKNEYNKWKICDRWI